MKLTGLGHDKTATMVLVALAAVTFIIP
ncbi:MAG: hypothetical protein RIR39_1940, partial [Pseudomonadota bacterium]